ncbi:MAG: beta-ketoacyl-[acyl-carrier-protein] synthase II [Acidobacteria bacterium]|nr:MAG: beta-ketoacyl-[acyl-carrier-protein] synthase II [Acidobacteriota bacterium]
MKRRVVVTGIGLVTPCGVGTRETWGALLEGRSGIGPISRFDAADFACRIAGEVRGFDPGQYLDRKDIRRMDTFIHYAVAASEMALKESGLTIGPANAERVGVLIGSGIGGIDVLTRQQQVLMEEGPRRVSPFLIPGMIINLASGLVSIRTGAKGPNSAVVTACATGTHAIGDSMRLIQHGDADAMIAGGAEAPIIPLSVAGFASMKALSTRNDEPQRASRPFDSGRDGFVIGEGAGVLVLEELSIAQRHDARIYAELVGYGMSGDAYHISAPPEGGDGAVRVMRAALEDAGLAPREIDYINAHGTSTPAEDALPPTINLDDPDPECDLDFVPNRARRVTVNHALNNSFGFGGTNAALLLAKFRP